MGVAWALKTESRTCCIEALGNGASGEDLFFTSFRLPRDGRWKGMCEGSAMCAGGNSRMGDPSTIIGVFAISSSMVRSMI